MLLNAPFSPYLPVQASFWPLLLRFSLLSIMFTVVMWLHGKISVTYLLVGLLSVAVISFLWWRDVVRERLIGYHTSKLEFGFRLSILLFILSEVFFFVSFFWAFYDSSVSPTVELGMTWPPKGIIPLDTYSIPLLNTVILLSSGVSVTWSHHALMNNNYSSMVVRLLVTVILGVYFLTMQYEEYAESQFSIADGSYGSTFFMSTGFHGIHVIVGTSMLFYTLLASLRGIFLYNHHFMFEASAWYWHFVDVVWLFLFIRVYWWGSLLA
jgi:cytochrome c oxidase subunit 3